ncbi:MAG: glutathione S-transferase family protein [Pseudomonadota bacterium]
MDTTEGVVIAMLKIWGRPNSICTQRALWACHEADVAYHLELASGTMGPDGHVSQGGAPFGHVDTDAYRAMNPNGTVPTLEDGDVVFWDSIAIVVHIAQKFAADRLYGGSPVTLAKSVQWMCWTNEHLEPQLHTLVMELVRLAPDKRSAEELEAARVATIAELQILDRHLGDHSFLAGNEFSMADIPAGATVYRWMLFDLEQPRLQNVLDWQNRLQDRDAFQQIVAPRENHIA